MLSAFRAGVGRHDERADASFGGVAAHRGGASSPARRNTAAKVAIREAMLSLPPRRLPTTHSPSLRLITITRDGLEERNLLLRHRQRKTRL